jgi:hypothetical protein
MLSTHFKGQKQLRLLYPAMDSIRKKSKLSFGRAEYFRATRVSGLAIRLGVNERNKRLRNKQDFVNMEQHYRLASGNTHA